MKKKLEMYKGYEIYTKISRTAIEVLVYPKRRNWLQKIFPYIGYIHEFFAYAEKGYIIDSIEEVYMERVYKWIDRYDELQRGE